MRNIPKPKIRVETTPAIVNRLLPFPSRVVFRSNSLSYCDFKDSRNKSLLDNNRKTISCLINKNQLLGVMPKGKSKRRLHITDRVKGAAKAKKKKK